MKKKKNIQDGLMDGWDEYGWISLGGVGSWNKIAWNSRPSKSSSLDVRVRQGKSEDLRPGCFGQSNLICRFDPRSWAWWEHLPCSQIMSALEGFRTPLFLQHYHGPLSNDNVFSIKKYFLTSWEPLMHSKLWLNWLLSSPLYAFLAT